MALPGAEGEVFGHLAFVCGGNQTDGLLFTLGVVKGDALGVIAAPAGDPAAGIQQVGQTDCPTDAARASLSSSILACNYVSSVSFIEDTTQMFDGLIGCLNYVVMLVIVCAAALAAVVLYNLISVNLGERKKELATIKVLGFYDKEVYRYIFREIDLLSLIGSLVGLVVGIPLHQFIIRTVEMDQMMFIRSIAPRSFVFSVALTMLFNFAVCLLMRRHVRQISLVDSMKAPE